ncbi:MAG: hypothetical protein KC464_04875, partial [Myxococcales bacterium]|nr:hypothetical protein [Myxococcales bacterium]
TRSAAAPRGPGDAAGGGATANAGPTCDDAGRNAAAQTGKTDTTGMSMDQLDAVGVAVATACAEDGWSADQIRCMAEATADGGTACFDKLSEAQRNGLVERMMPIYDGHGAPAGADGDVDAESEDAADDLASDPCEGGE